MITYKEQFDKLTRAYINNEVYPYKDCACFVGNLLDGSTNWGFLRDSIGEVAKPSYRADFAIDWLHRVTNGQYTQINIVRMEENFMDTIRAGTPALRDCATTNHPNYENTLFAAFESTLEMLKQIHIKNGEVIDETPVFVKRELAKV